ncbi:integrase catalytic domain-containing protein [Nephila pilipes]|uniref:Integrase catalytic domain-containing protein n=1 Tax=Nephila pilipes TaxID=299642 RepID=A0A8X6P559_NEPPI|nr:integrase catalytic domain-containing protein [Nephila pilipes]
MFKNLVERVVMGTDFETCLYWIMDSAMDRKQFVANRVVQIQDCFAPDNSGVDLLGRNLRSPTGLNRNSKCRMRFYKRVAVNTAIEQNDPVIDASRFSNLAKLLKVTVHVRLFWEIENW